MTDAKQKIRQFVVRNFLFGKDNGLTDNASFLEQGIIDSTGVLELVAFVESDFGIKVDDTELVPDNFDSIDAVAAYLEKKAGAAAPAKA
jgi:acyl carrier protein